ncbi:chloride channel protein [Hydrogenophaga sp. 5NK40-0174]|uniref:chloride channel protein n=1 Tax=Hydrogenophaga sp. 5NK40-0174 TaxID=3127649 RepID=UPI003108E5C2
MTREPDFLQNLQDELSDGRAWLDRSIVMGYAVLAGLFVVIFALMSEYAFELFEHLRAISPWIVLVWTPAIMALIVWATRRWFPGAAGSGIPQVMVALEPGLPESTRMRFVSLRVTLAKMFLGALGMLAGASAGREGPSVQVGAGVLHHARRWLRPASGIGDRGLLLAGGAAGIAAAFNAPLAGVVFAIEELSKRMEARYNGVIIASIVIAGVVGIAVFGNVTYFGSLDSEKLEFLPSLAVVVSCGLLGGLFSRLLSASMAGMPDTFCRFRHRHPVRFAAICGLAIGVIGMVTGGATFGAGGEEVRHMLSGESDISRVYFLLKLIATWLTQWSGVPGGIFAPSLSIGAGIGHDIAQVVSGSNASTLAPTLIALGMASFLAATTQAPLTSFIIVMEMIDGRPLVLSLMTASMVASLISRMISRPLYGSLKDMMMARNPGPTVEQQIVPEEEGPPREADVIAARTAEEAEQAREAGTSPDSELPGWKQGVLPIDSQFDARDGAADGPATPSDGKPS